MTKQQWPIFAPFFIPSENWGSPKKMDYTFMWLLWRLRLRIDLPFIVHCGYAWNGHAKKSFHKKGKAGDLHIKDFTFRDPGYLHDTSDIVSWININCWVLREVIDFWPFGIGFYPYWNNPGFHLDIGPRRIWWRDRDEEYHYIVRPERKYLELVSR